MKSPTFRRIAALSLLGVCLIVTTIGAQQFNADISNDGKTARLVCKMIERYHIGHSRVNDEISSRLFDRFIKDLDPNKLYFIESDIKSLNVMRKKLDDNLKNGNVQFAQDVFSLYLKTMVRQTALAQKLIEQKQDFTIDEEMVTDADDLPWAKTQDELNERWRKRIKYELLDLKLGEEGKDLEKAHEKLHRRYRTISSNLRLTDEHEITEMYLTALARSFDPHSSYMSPRTLEDFQINMRLSLDGIGAQLRYDDGFTVVAEIVPGGAADTDGRLEPGDKIVAVGQETGDFVDIVEMKLKNVVQLIRGKRGTTVRLKVKKADSDDQEMYAMVRQKIELKQSEVKGEIINGTDADVQQRTGRPVKIGIIKIPSFYRDFEGAQRGIPDFKSTEKDVRKVLANFESQGGVDAVVIDLRNNGGGALSEAIGVSGLFIKKGSVVQVKELDGTIRSHRDENPDVAYAGPLVVICNRLSASASEIFAAVIKDYNRGIIVGDTTTHGKGTVQNVMPVSDPGLGGRLQLFRRREDLGALKLTIQQFYRVNGDSTQNRGVRSDVVLPSRIDHMDLGESFLDNALPFDSIPEANDTYNVAMTSGPVINRLKQDSEKRISASENFKKVKKQIDRYVKRKSRKSVSLNENVLGKQRKIEEEELEALFPELKKKKAKEKDKDKKKKKEKKEIFPKGFYNDEVLHITADYATLLKQAKVVQGR